MILYCATTNAGKLREFFEASRRLGPGAPEFQALPDVARVPAPEETGATFEANAILKAEYYSRLAPGPLIAEDSGLEVAALDNRPGVHSARFAGLRATGDENNRLLLNQLEGIQDRRARYVAVIALAQNGAIRRTFTATVQGSILTEPRGAGGFGYDPLFYYPPFEATFAEVPLSRKQSVSHRAQAIEKLLSFLQAE